MEGKIEIVRHILQTSQPVNKLPSAAKAPSEFLDATVSNSDLAQVGIQLLKSGKIAVLMVAGGMSTRMADVGLRGNLPIGPVTARSIFRLQGEKIAAVKKRFALELPWLVMTSIPVHDATVRSFLQENYFGIPPDDVWFFKQSSLPVLDANQNPVKLADGTCLESPVGHGGVLEALSSSGLLQRLRQRGIEYLFYFQYPNVLERVCDPVMLGYHYLGGYEVTTKAIFNYAPEEKVGRCVEVDGILRIIEYHFLKDVLLKAWWHGVPGSIATHIWNISFIERCLKQGVQLPYYVVPHYRTIAAPEPLQKIEQFIFDLIPYARATGLIIVKREDEYAPVKSMTGTDSLENAKKALTRLYCKWLEQAGAYTKGSPVRIEISPHFALSVDDLKDKLPPRFRYDDGLMLY